MSNKKSLVADFEVLLAKTAQLQCLVQKTHKTESDLRRNVMFMKQRFESTEALAIAEAESTHRAII
jgi:hypothetical protein